MVKERKGKLIGKIVTLAVVCAAIVATAIALIGIFEIRSTYLDMVKELLHASVVQADSEYTKMWDGDWTYEDGVIKKGGEEVYDEYLATMEETKAETGLDYTIFYNDTRVVTTLKNASGAYLTNTQASAEIVSKVVGSGQNVYNSKLNIEGMHYYGYYVPMRNTDGSIVGMMFTGREASDINKAILKVTIIMIIVLVVGVAALFILGLMASNIAGKNMKKVAEEISVLATGDLSRKIPDELLARKDEIGIIAESVENFIARLREIMGASKKLSGNVSQSGDELSTSSQLATQASSQVTSAVDDISKGAVSQAESVQNSAMNVGNIGNDIETISSNVSTLTDYTEEMKTACRDSMDALDMLLNQNKGVVKSMGEIDSAIRSTNDAANNIANSTNLITDIASQTNLLSLNASIEAARAGEAGRGFAVVAQEIGALAEQSAKTADEISNIVRELTEESKRSVQTIDQLNEELDAQSKQIDQTKADMEKMEVGVNSVSQSTEEIASRVSALETAKENLLTIIEDLSAVSEENAASTQETNASMEELNATFEVINHSAEELKDLAAQLDEQISFFKIEE